MKKLFQTKNNNNFYFLKEIQWSNKAMKLNPINSQFKGTNKLKNKSSVNYCKEKSWNKRFIYDKIQNYDSSKDRNFIASISRNDDMNCYHNAIKKNEIIMKSFYPNKKNKKIKAEEYNKTNIRITLNPMGKNMKKAQIMHNSFSTNNIKNSRLFSSDFVQNKNELTNFKKLLSNEKNSPDKITKIWNDLCILEPYRELFSILITQLSDKGKADFCEREFNELLELKNNLQLLSTSVFYRSKILENINDLNDQLGDMLRNKQSASNEVILKKISKKIENLREHTVNICLLMQKIKLKINQGHSWGKYDLEAICEKYKFDKNYLIKMKEEMCVLKEGYAKYFFDISEDSNPFLLKASEPAENKDKSSDPFFHYVPITNQMRENINQCIYIIYQELIEYQISSVSENNFRNISPLKKFKYTEVDIKNYKKYNESLNTSVNTSIFSLSNNQHMFQKSSAISPSRTMYSGMHKSSNLTAGDKIININNKRILSGIDKENNTFNNFFKKLDKNSNDTGDKTTYYNYKFMNNNDIKDLIEKNNNQDIEIDINSKKNIINSQEESKEDNKEINNINKNDNINENKSNIENIENNEDINNFINLKKDEHIITKSEKEEIKEEINEKTEKENNNNFDINKLNKEKVIENKNERGFNYNLEKITEEDKYKTESMRNNNNENNEVNEKIINGESNNNIQVEENTINNIENNINNIDNEKENNIENNILEKEIINKEKDEENEKIDLNNLEEDEKVDNNEKKEGENSKNINITNNNINNKSKSNKSILPIIKQLNLKITIFSDDIGLFSKEFYFSYYSSIPTVIKKMFQIKENIINNILNGISPYMLLIHENLPLSEGQENWIHFKNEIMGLCLFSFECNYGKIKLVINHISTYDVLKEKENNELKEQFDQNSLEQIRQIFKVVIIYIKKNFYFDEIIIRYNIEGVNENILNIFLDDLNFVVVNENENDFYDYESDENIKKSTIDINNKNRNNDEISSKLVYTNDSTKNRVNDIIRQSIQKYIGNNIFDIFDCVLQSRDKELISLEKSKRTEGNFVNKYFFDKKEKSNLYKLYNKITNLDQLIKIFQNNNVNNKELPISLGKNIYDISSVVLNKTLFNNYFNNLFFFNNYNNNDSNSFFDKNTGIFYNYIKAKKMLLLENEKYHTKFCHIISNNLSLFFCRTNDDLNKYLNKNNIYNQINNIYRETLSLDKKYVIEDKIIWIPCFHVYKHIKTMGNTLSGTIHEFIKISNQKIKQTNRELLRINSNNNENYSIKIEPDLNRDFILDTDFIFGIINNADILNKKLFEQSNNDKILINSEEENISEEIEGNVDVKENKNDPYVIFLSYVKKSNFIINNI